MVVSQPWRMRQGLHAISAPGFEGRTPTQHGPAQQTCIHAHVSPDCCFRGQDRGSGDTHPDILVQLCPQHTHMSARAVTGVRAHIRVLLCSLPSGRTVAQPTAPNTMAWDRTSRRGSHEAKRALPHSRLHLSPPVLPTTPACTANRPREPGFHHGPWSPGPPFLSDSCRDAWALVGTALHTPRP